MISQGLVPDRHLRKLNPFIYKFEDDLNCFDVMSANRYLIFDEVMEELVMAIGSP